MANNIPSDKDKYQSTDKVIRQVDCQYSFGDEAANFIIKLAGSTADVVATAGNYRKGKRVLWTDFKNNFDELSGLTLSGLAPSGKVVSSTSTTKQGSAQATITFQIPYKDKLSLSEGSADNPEQRKIVSWSEKSTTHEFPLAVYAGDADLSSGDEANAGAFEAWQNQKTKDNGLYENFQYEISGDVKTLDGRTKELAELYYKGIEAVERGYPEVVRTTQYFNYRSGLSSVSADLISQIDERPNLYHIDATPSAIWGSLFDNFSWLKTAYDVEIEPTEYDRYWNMTVTEAWQGIDIDERGPWNNNLYGWDPDRWKFATQQGESQDDDFPPLPDIDDPDYEEKIMTTWIQYTNNKVEGIDAEGTWNGSAIAEDKVSTILQIDLGQAVTGIASNAFYGYPNLRTVYVPTTVATIAENAFLSGPVGVSFIDRTLDEISAMTNYPWGIDPEHIEIYE